MDTTLKCDMCHKPLKEKRFQIVPLLRPEMALTVGPDCYRKEQKARKELLATKTPEEIAALKAKVAAHHANK